MSVKIDTTMTIFGVSSDAEATEVLHDLLVTAADDAQQGELSAEGKAALMSGLFALDDVREVRTFGLDAGVDVQAELDLAVAATVDGALGFDERVDVMQHVVGAVFKAEYVEVHV